MRRAAFGAARSTLGRTIRGTQRRFGGRQGARRQQLVIQTLGGTLGPTLVLGNKAPSTAFTLGLLIGQTNLDDDGT